MPAKNTAGGFGGGGGRGGSGSGAARGGGGGRHASSSPPKRGGSTSRGKHQAPTGAERVAAGARKVQNKVNQGRNPFTTSAQARAYAKEQRLKKERAAAIKSGKNPFMLEGPKKSSPRKGR